MQKKITIYFFVLMLSTIQITECIFQIITMITNITGQA